MKVKELIKKLQKYNPEFSVSVMVADECETKKNRATEFVYLFSDKIKVKKDSYIFEPTDKLLKLPGKKKFGVQGDKYILVFGDVTEVLHG